VQHGKTDELSDGIQVQEDQFAPEEVQNREKLARRQAKPNDEMRFKADNGGIVYHWELQIRDGGFYLTA
jgi:hypothetical protein